MVQEESTEREGTSCEACGANFPTSDALQTHGLVAHAEGHKMGPRHPTRQESDHDSQKGSKEWRKPGVGGGQDKEGGDSSRAKQ